MTLDPWPDTPATSTDAHRREVGPVLLGPPPVDPRAARVRVALWRARPVAAGLAAVAVVLGAARTAAPPPERGVAVVVTAVDVAPGDRLDARALRVVQARPGTVPDGAPTTVEDVLGREALVALPAGLVVVEAVLAGQRFAVEPPVGTVVVAVRLADPAVTGLLRPGDRVDLVTAAAADGTTTAVTADVVARDALVLDRTTVDDTGGPLGLGTPTSGAVLTVVAVPPEVGRRLAAVLGWADVGAVLVDGDR